MLLCHGNEIGKFSESDSLKLEDFGFYAAYWLVVTARIRRMREGNIFSLSTLVGGYTVQGLWVGGVYPIPGLGGGVPCPRSGWGYPISGLGGGGVTPSQVWVGGTPDQVWMVGGGTQGTPPPTMTGWGTPQITQQKSIAEAFGVFMIR